MSNVIKGFLFLFAILIVFAMFTFMWPLGSDLLLKFIAGIQIGTWCWNYTSKKWPHTS